MNTRNISTRLLFTSARTIQNEAQWLHFLNLALRERIEEAHHSVEQRIGLHHRIAECSESGKVALIESGRDCDGVMYWGRVHLVDATLAAVLDKEALIARWADGPFQLRIERPTVAEEIEYHSRDLGAEAFEDGHAHCLYAD